MVFVNLCLLPLGTWILMSLGFAKPNSLLNIMTLYHQMVIWMVYAGFIGIFAGLKGPKLLTEFEHFIG